MAGSKPMIVDHSKDAETLAKYQVHVAKRKKRNLEPFTWEIWLECFLQGKYGGKHSTSDKSAAGKKGFAARVKNQGT